MTRAVAGATTTRSQFWPSRVCGIGSGPSNSDVRAGSDASAEKVERPDEPGGAGGQDGHDVGAGVDQAAADLDGLVGGDPARNAEDDAPAGERELRLQPEPRPYLIDLSTTSGRS